MHASGEYQLSGEDIYAAYRMRSGARGRWMLAILTLVCGGMLLLPGPLSYRLAGAAGVWLIWLCGVSLQEVFWRKAAARQSPLRIAFSIDAEGVTVTARKMPFKHAWSNFRKGYFDQDRAVLVLFGPLGNSLHFPARGFAVGSPDDVKELFRRSLKSPSA